METATTTYTVDHLDSRVTVTTTSDKQSMHNVELANQASEMLKTSLAMSVATLKKTAGNSSSGSKETSSPLHIVINIMRCTEGSRMGRICCGEIGVGWACFFFDWYLQDTTNKNKILLGIKTEKFRDSGAAGIADVCQSDLGDQHIHRSASVLGPLAIVKELEQFFGADSTEAE